MRGFRQGAAAFLCVAALACPARAQSGEPPPPPFAVPSSPPQAAPPPDVAAPPVRVSPGSVASVEAAIVARDVAFVLGPVTVKAPHVEIIGARQSAEEIAALLRVGDAAEAQRRLRAFAATRVTAPSVTLTVELHGLRQSADYKNVRLENVEDGRVARAGAETISVETTGGDLESSGQMAGFSVERLDVAAGLRLLFEAAPPGSAPVELYGPFKIDSYLVTAKDGATEMRGLSGGAIRVTPGERPAAEIFSALSRFKPDDGVEALLSMLAAARGLVAGMEMDAARVESVTFAPKVGETGAVARIDGLWMRDFRRGLASFGFDAMRVDAKESETTVAGFEIVDYDQLSVLDVVTKVLSDPKAVTNLNPATLAPSFRRVALRSVVSCAPPRAPCAADAATFAMEGAELERAPAEGGLDWRLDVHRFRTPASGDAPATDGRWSSLIAWRPTQRTLTLRDATLKLEGYGEASLSTELENVLPAIFTENRVGALIALTPVAARRAALRLSDAGAIDKLAAAEATTAKPETPAGRKTGAAGAKARPKASSKASPETRPEPRTPGELREALAARIAREVAARGEAPAIGALAKALGDFVRDPSLPLTLTASAEPPIGGLDIIGGDVARLLGRVSLDAQRK